MLNDFPGADKVYIACGYTDLRKGIVWIQTGPHFFSHFHK